MKIKEKVKNFTKEHKNDLIIAAASTGAVAIGTIGFVLGRKFTFGEIENFIKIDLTQGYAYNVRDIILKDILKDETIVPEALAKAGITSLEETVKSVVLVQKK